jgi:hypothetical protein
MEMENRTRRPVRRLKAAEAEAELAEDGCNRPAV